MEQFKKIFQSGESCELDEIRSESKRALETFELWSRKLINDEMTVKYGKDYFNITLEDGNSLIKQDIIRTINDRMKDDPNRFPRAIDAILIEDLAYFLCRDDFYLSMYKKVLEPSFSGQAEIRNRIEILSKIRNRLNHGNPISKRDAQRVICYSYDFVDCYKEYYKRNGKEKDYNVPTFIKAEDSYGRCVYRSENDYQLDMFSSLNNTAKVDLRLRPGDVYEVWLEVDPSFPSDFYDIVWFVHDKLVGKGPYYKYVVSIKDVSSPIFIHAELRTHREWHLSGQTDDWFKTYLGTILPPIEDLI